MKLELNLQFELNLKLKYNFKIKNKNQKNISDHLNEWNTVHKEKIMQVEQKFVSLFFSHIVKAFLMTRFQMAWMKIKWTILKGVFVLFSLTP